MAAWPHADLQSTVTEVCVGCPSLLRPSAYFVAWNGVLALVYSGFPPVLATLKSRLNEPSCGLKKENFGSKWPKTTLGALVDGAELTMDELTKLRALCLELGPKLSVPETAVRVEQLSFVRYAQRGLEPVDSRQRVDIALLGAAGVTAAGAAAAPPSTTAGEAPSEEELERVRGVLGEWDDLGDYLPKVNAPGSRIGSYRHDSPSGSTLVAFLDGPNGAAPAALFDAVRELKAAVDAALPGKYAWLDEASLHCTIRALADA